MVRSELPTGRQSDAGERPWWQLPWFVVSVAALLVVALLAIWVVASGGASDDTTGTTTTLAGSGMPGAGNANPDPAAPSGDQSAGLTEAPKDTTWTLWYGIALPSSSSAGPREPATSSGYSHDPAGALYAAATIPYRAYGPDWRVIVERQTIAGPARDKLIAELERAHAGGVDMTGVAQTAGFRFVSYSPDTAVVEFATKGRNLNKATSTVRWVDGDWRLVLGPDGSLGSQATRITSLGGFIPWSGVA
jgi:hypothetical protein